MFTLRLMIKNNPKYKNLEPIVNTGLGRNVFLFFKEDQLKKNLTLMRRMPHFVLLGNFDLKILVKKILYEFHKGGMINQKLYTRSGIQDYAKLENLETLRGQLVGTLNALLAQVPNTLSAPINNLSQALSQHSKSNE